ncbi:MAG TPA: uridine kinase [Verrucomicrobiae bacterium]|nr:uridine kinase [Verrucomicrobiae bacterium]
MQATPKLIAIVGGSGAGKTWLARRLELQLQPAVSRLSLDDFYLDRSSVPERQRESLNYDHPRAIDWARLEKTLQHCRAGRTSAVPRYDFATHTRQPDEDLFTPMPVVMVDGLWLLVQSRIRDLFDFTIFIDCPEQLRRQRRLERDVIERGRKSMQVLTQFAETVVPMHERFVAPQAATADIVLRHSPEPAEIENLAETIRALMSEDEATAEEDFSLAWSTGSTGIMNTVAEQFTPSLFRHHA